MRRFSTLVARMGSLPCLRSQPRGADVWAPPGPTDEPFGSPLPDGPDDRRRLARQVHDLVGNNISLVLRYLDLHEIRSEADGAVLGQELEAARALLTSVLLETRRLASSLRLDSPTDSVAGALRSFVADFAPEQMEVDVQVHGDEQRLSNQQREELFLMLREGLRNVFSHSHARSAQVRLIVCGRQVHAMLADDGLGFDPDDVAATATGLVCMRERAEVLGGELRLATRPGAGTRWDLLLSLTSARRPEGSDVAVR